MKWQSLALEPRIMLAADAGASVPAMSTPALIAPTSVALTTSNQVGDTAGQSAANADQADFAAPQLNTVGTEPTEIVFVDPRVEDLSVLENGISQDAELILLNTTSDALEQISRHLRSRTNIQSVHIVSHGTRGQLQLGNQAIGLTQLQNSSALLRQWTDSLTADADLLVYGCDVGGGHIGVAFAHRLASLTGADVALSNDKTGNQPNADWALEVQVGDIDSSLVFSQTARAQWHGVLSTGNTDEPADIFLVVPATASNLVDGAGTEPAAVKSIAKLDAATDATDATDAPANGKAIGKHASDMYREENASSDAELSAETIEAPLEDPLIAAADAVVGPEVTPTTGDQRDADPPVIEDQVSGETTVDQPVSTIPPPPTPVSASTSTPTETSTVAIPDAETTAPETTAPETTTELTVDPSHLTVPATNDTTPTVASLDEPSQDEPTIPESSPVEIAPPVPATQTPLESADPNMVTLSSASSMQDDLDVTGAASITGISESIFGPSTSVSDQSAAIGKIATGSKVAMKNAKVVPPLSAAIAPASQIVIDAAPAKPPASAVPLSVSDATTTPALADVPKRARIESISSDTDSTPIADSDCVVHSHSVDVPANVASSASALLITDQPGQSSQPSSESTQQGSKLSEEASFVIWVQREQARSDHLISPSHANCETIPQDSQSFATSRPQNGVDSTHQLNPLITQSNSEQSTTQTRTGEAATQQSGGQANNELHTSVANVNVAAVDATPELDGIFDVGESSEAQQFKNVYGNTLASSTFWLELAVDPNKLVWQADVHTNNALDQIRYLDPISHYVGR
ncbi:MAG: DUF4347 domain-containing protein [Pirellulaceae bacterium]|nr:DUF4347 domain-containing protein [Pirellulaceae bacterium]